MMTSTHERIGAKTREETKEEEKGGETGEGMKAVQG